MLRLFSGMNLFRKRSAGTFPPVLTSLPHVCLLRPSLGGAKQQVRDAVEGSEEPRELNDNCAHT